MKRFVRILLNVATVASAVLCVGTALLWVRSYDEAEAFGSREEHSPLLAQARGMLVVGTGSFADEDPGHRRALQVGSIDGIEQLSYLYVYGEQFAWSWGSRGFYVAASEPLGAPGRRNWCLVCPHWAVVGVTAVLPLVAGVRTWRGRRRGRAGRCRVCEYNLHGNQSEVCPECGTPTTVKA